MKFRPTPAQLLKSSSRFYKLSLSSDLEFHIGEKVLVFLNKLPFKLHFALSDVEVPEVDKAQWRLQWYKTHLSGTNEYELQTYMKARYKIDGDKIRWFEKNKDLGAIIKELQSYLE